MYGSDPPLQEAPSPALDKGAHIYGQFLHPIGIAKYFRPRPKKPEGRGRDHSHINPAAEKPFYAREAEKVRVPGAYKEQAFSSPRIIRHHAQPPFLNKLVSNHEKHYKP